MTSAGSSLPISRDGSRPGPATGWRPRPVATRSRAAISKTWVIRTFGLQLSRDGVEQLAQRCRDAGRIPIECKKLLHRVTGLAISGRDIVTVPEIRRGRPVGRPRTSAPDSRWPPTPTETRRAFGRSEPAARTSSYSARVAAATGRRGVASRTTSGWSSRSPTMAPASVQTNNARGSPIHATWNVRPSRRHRACRRRRHTGPARRPPGRGTGPTPDAAAGTR